MFRPAVVMFAIIVGACSHAPSEEPAKAAGPAPMIVGGYGPADLASPDVKAAEKLAIDEIYRREPQRGLVENVTREQQVVAGMNYRFSVKMTGQNAYRIVVYKPLQGEMQVSSFEKLSGN